MNNNTNGTARFDGTPHHSPGADGTQPLERLKEAAGLSWRGFARALGVDPKQVSRWRKGVEPAGGAMLSIVRFACRIPGGLQILIGEGLQMSFFREES